ncbi:MAG: hypothetical protein J3K34DRAFT_487656 [Monoraphidium minutum]|nr:MAG: hypothetical protein J3K34DRAFT_487656 [Monoraphidium minutum]
MAQDFEQQADPEAEMEAETLYWAAVQDSLAGRHGAAHAKLRALGCRYALSPAMWDACLPQSSVAAAAARGGGGRARVADGPGPPGRPPPVWALDGGLPPRLLARLTAAFGAGAPYWRHHAYFEGGTPFFSYVFTLPREGGGGSGDPRSGGDKGGGSGDGGRPAHALAAAAALLRARCREAARRGGGGCGAAGAAALLESATHAEFWAHTRPLDAPHQLHFDVNEGFLRRGPAAYRLTHPAASSLLFLSDAGGPTAVLDQTPAGARGGAPAAADEEGGGKAAVPGAEDGSGSAEGGPPAKRRRDAATAAAEPAAAAGTAGVGLPLDETAARQLAARAWLLRPAKGRWAVWPGDLLHGVLPGALQQLEGDEDGDAGEQQGSGGAAIAPRWRTTLVLAWWRGDPRSALEHERGCEGSDGEAAAAAGAGAGAPAEAAGGGEGPAPAWPRPMMALPLAAGTAAGGGGAAGPVGTAVGVAGAAAPWLDDLWLYPGEWEALEAEAAAEAGATARAVEGVAAPLEEVSPAWVRVEGAAGAGARGSEAAAAAAASGGAGAPGDGPAGEGADARLARARLPPLRFFLPGAGAIAAAYPIR